MKLYHAPTSPFVRKVVVLLHEAGALDQVALIPAVGTPLAPGTMPVDRLDAGRSHRTVYSFEEALALVKGEGFQS